MAENCDKADGLISREQSINFAAKSTQDQNLRYKSRINPDDQHPDAVDFGEQPSFSLDSSIFGSLK